MSDRFLKNMEHMLENTKGLSLKILFEEKEENKKKEDPFADAFGSDDSDDEAGDSSSDDEAGDISSDDEAGDSSSDDEAGDSSEESPGASNDVYDDLHTLSDFTKTVADANDEKERVKNKFKFKPESIISSSFNPIISHKNKPSLDLKNLLLMKEENKVDKTLDKVEKTIEDEQERIEKLGDDAHSISSKIVKGFKINHEKEASEALSNFENFDAKFSTAEIIANMYIDRISDLSSPQDLEKNIKDFLQSFNKLLPADSKIDIQEEPTKYNTGTGGKTPSG